mmetsp:Transcript_331/g.582  ORF Transcript_331/g.582 Transcript_331/m.582 type:complete len:500 (-) Transcript_331:320-1819(-)
MSYNATAYNIQIASILSSISAVESSVSDVATGADEMWVLVAGILVFFMQAGFAMLEAGSVRSKNSVNILFKNILDAAISAFFFWLLGFGFAYGETQGGFIGGDLFALDDITFTATSGSGVANLNYHTFFFQWAFAATAATIVSGCVAERCKLEAYFVYSAVISGFIYPVVVHWGWGDGWLSPFGSDVEDYLMDGAKSNNLIDFAGSGIVHMVGGWSGLVAAIVLGPRKGRFAADGTPVDIPGHSAPMAVLGTLLLWVGWYGFNAGSTLCIVGCSKLAAKVATTTTLAAAGAVWTAVIYQTAMRQQFSLSLVGNSVLAGLVSITAPCAVVDPWAAWLTGMIGGLCFIGSSNLLKMLKIDDPCDASPIHGFCGFWGVVACGIFGTDENAAFAGYVGSAAGETPIEDGEQLGVQIIGALAITAWTLGTATIMFLIIHFTIGMRVDESVEDAGLDSSEHGVKAYDYIGEGGTKTIAVAPAAEKQYASDPSAVVPVSAEAEEAK